jgi:uncharacterized protein YbbK (DUF523 family)
VKFQKILISACLLGEDVKYNGDNNDIRDNGLIKKLFNLGMLVPVCPEVEGGLPIPRVAVELQNGKAIDKHGNDKTKDFQKGATLACEIARKENIKVALMKSRSPSCGKSFIYDGTFSKRLIKGHGISIKALENSGIKVFDENSLKELALFLNK